MEIIILGLVLAMLILLFIRLNSITQVINILSNDIDDVELSLNRIEQDLKEIKENIAKLSELCNNIKTDISTSNSSIIRNENDHHKNYIAELDLTRRSIIDKFNTIKLNIGDAGNMLNNSILDSHKALMGEIKTIKTTKTKTSNNTKTKSTLNKPENCR